MDETDEHDRSHYVPANAGGKEVLLTPDGAGVRGCHKRAIGEREADA